MNFVTEGGVINWRFCKRRGRTGDGYHKREAHDKSGRLNGSGDRLGLTGEREMGITSGRHTTKAGDLTGLATDWDSRENGRWGSQAGGTRQKRET